MQRALFQQVSPCKPCADPHMNLPEKGNAHISEVQRVECVMALLADVFISLLQSFQTPPAAGVWMERTESRYPICHHPPEG